MPKIKDLGINIVPGTMRPPEIGGGGGGGWCGGRTHGWWGGGETGTVECETQRTVPPMCTECNCISQDCMPASWWPHHKAQQMQQRTIFTDTGALECPQPSANGCSQCNCVSDQCVPASWRPWGQHQQQAVGAQMVGGGNDTQVFPCDPVPTSPGACSQCDCVSIGGYLECAGIVTRPPQCLGGSIGTRITPQTPNLAPGMLGREEIAALRGQLKKALENLDIAEKNLLPKTLEEIDAREKELQSELEALKARRSELKK